MTFKMISLSRRELPTGRNVTRENDRLRDPLIRYARKIHQRRASSRSDRMCRPL